MADLTFRQELKHSPINLPRAALCLAREIAYPDLDVGRYMAQIEQLAAGARRVVLRGAPIIVQAEALSDYLFDEVGLRGNARNFTDPRNSYLNEVLDRRLGIPISLSVVYIVVAQRIALPVEGVGLPGRFIVVVQDPSGEVYLDPFHGGARLTAEDCMRIVREMTGYTGPFEKRWLAPAAPQDILARMLNNLRIIYLGRENWRKAMAVLKDLRILQPEVPSHLRDLGLAYQGSGSLVKAVYYLERYLLRVPKAADASIVKSHLQAAVEKLARWN